jgi:hypothetical protein
MLDNQKASLIAALLGNAIHVDDIPKTDTTPKAAEMRRRGMATGELFTQVVHSLRSDSRISLKVRDMAALLWDLVEHRVTPVVLTEMPSLYFVTQGSIAGASAGTILVPWNWIEMVRTDPQMQAGGAVNMGSQCRDFYNDKIDFLNMNEKKERAYCFEVEFLLTIQHDDPDWKPNDYQSKIMRDFPRGLDSLRPGLWYESKPYYKR